MILFTTVYWKHETRYEVNTIRPTRLLENGNWEDVITSRVLRTRYIFNCQIGFVRDIEEAKELIEVNPDDIYQQERGNFFSFQKEIPVLVGRGIPNIAPRIRIAMSNILTRNHFIFQTVHHQRIIPSPRIGTFSDGWRSIKADEEHFYPFNQWIIDNAHRIPTLWGS